MGDGVGRRAGGLGGLASQLVGSLGARLEGRLGLPERHRQALAAVAIQAEVGVREALHPLELAARALKAANQLLGIAGVRGDSGEHRSPFGRACAGASVPPRARGDKGRAPGHTAAGPGAGALTAGGGPLSLRWLLPSYMFLRHKPARGSLLDYTARSGVRPASGAQARRSDACT